MNILFVCLDLKINMLLVCLDHKMKILFKCLDHKMNILFVFGSQDEHFTYNCVWIIR